MFNHFIKVYLLNKFFKKSVPLLDKSLNHKNVLKKKKKKISVKNVLRLEILFDSCCISF